MVGIYNDVIKTATRSAGGPEPQKKENRSVKQAAAQAPAGFFQRFRGIRLSIFG